jgi:hypothetical protein
MDSESPIPEPDWVASAVRQSVGYRTYWRVKVVGGSTPPQIDSALRHCSDSGGGVCPLRRLQP